VVSWAAEGVFDYDKVAGLLTEASRDGGEEAVPGVCTQFEEGLRTLLRPTEEGLPPYHDTCTHLYTVGPARPVQKKYTGWLDYADIAALVLARSVSHQQRAGIAASIASALTSDEEHRCDLSPSSSLSCECLP
jgi:hypothetical protein